MPIRRGHIDPGLGALAITYALSVTQILTFHVVPGRLLAADVANLTSAKTVQGQDVTFANSGSVTVNGATVTKANIETDNGVIHVIDQVILPK